MATIQYLTTVQFDFGAIDLLAAEMQRIGMRKPLFVTDRGVRNAGLLERALRAARLDERDVAVFDQTPPNPTEDGRGGGDGAVCAERLRRRHRRSAAVPPIDLAKATALLATHPAPLGQYAAVEGGLAHASPRKVAPLVAIPTTAGTGSEVGRGSVIVMRSTGASSGCSARTCCRRWPSATRT